MQEKERFLQQNAVISTNVEERSSHVVLIDCRFWQVSFVSCPVEMKNRILKMCTLFSRTMLYSWYVFWWCANVKCNSDFGQASSILAILIRL